MRGAWVSVVVLQLWLLASPVAAATPDWLPSIAASGDNTYVGAIDAPLPNARVGPGKAIQIAGWFVDRSAQGWAGADDVEIFLGSMGNGGTLLAPALFTLDRPDVARALGNPYWSASGWSATVPSDALQPGSNTLSVYVHTPAKGWWLRQVTVELEAAAGAPPRAPAPGYDVSFPQCEAPQPVRPEFSILGVNGGRVFTGNPCLPRQYAWAQTSASVTQPRVSLYMNTGNPGPELSQRWPPAGTTSPRACDGTWSTACAYDYGWAAANDALARARGVVGANATQLPWWLDVEIANSWSETDRTTNAAALEGSIDALRTAGVGSIGIYALAADWEEITGAASADSPINAPFAGLPNWRPGPRTAAEAPSWCSRSVTGGRVKFVQYAAGPFDGNYACY